jgi:N-acylglucosamine 2-epimerase
MVESLVERYKRELFDSVVPFWLNHSLDREHGGYFTGLDRDGSLYDPRKYVWMQGRAVWMFARLCNSTGHRDEWAAAARSIVEFLRKYARRADGTVWFSLQRDGSPAFFQRKPYAGFFLVLAYAEWYKMTGEPWYLDEARALYKLVREWIADPTLLGRPGPPVSQLADIMVEASMALELLSIDPHDRYREHMAACLKRVAAHERDGLLLENIAPRDLPEGRLFCPGSAAEVGWFLLRCDPSRAQRDFLIDMIARAIDCGWDAEHGGLFYLMDAEGKPPAQLEAPMKLWWPHTEAIVASAQAYSITHDPDWLTRLDRIDRYAFGHFADPVHGEWFGYCERDGTVSNTLKGGPYKGFFHVPRALLFAIQLLDRV